MSDTIIVAFTTGIFGLLSAFVTGYATIKAVEKKDGQPPAGKSILPVVLIAAIVGGLVGFLIGTLFVQERETTSIQPSPTVDGGTSSNGLNCTATPHTSLSQADHNFTGSVHIVELWRANKQSPWEDKLVTAVVLGDVNIIEAGGSVWTYPEGCEDIAKREVLEGANRTGAIVVTEADLRSAGMIE